MQGPGRQNVHQENYSALRRVFLPVLQGAAPLHFRETLAYALRGERNRKTLRKQGASQGPEQASSEPLEFPAGKDWEE